MKLREQKRINKNYEKMREQLADHCHKCGEKIIDGGCYDVPVIEQGETIYMDLCESCFIKYEIENEKQLNERKPKLK